jgi:hypothetical protein
MGCRAHRKNAEALNQGSLATGFCRVPIFSISIVTLSPAFNHRGPAAGIVPSCKKAIEASVIELLVVQSGLNK